MVNVMHFDLNFIRHHELTPVANEHGQYDLELSF